MEPTTVKPGEGFTGIGLPENDIFYFHPDHLGSTSYITTRNGSICQHVEYIAFNSSFYCFFGIVESHKIDLGRFCSRSILARFLRRTCLMGKNSTEKRILAIMELGIWI